MISRALANSSLQVCCSWEAEQWLQTRKNDSNTHHICIYKENKACFYRCGGWWWGPTFTVITLADVLTCWVWADMSHTSVLLLLLLLLLRRNGTLICSYAGIDRRADRKMGLKFLRHDCTCVQHISDQIHPFTLYLVWLICGRVIVRG